MTRDALNRAISESIEPMPVDPPLCRTLSPNKGWDPRLLSMGDGCAYYGWIARDWDTDESANAILLDAMPAPELYKITSTHWSCRSDWGLEGREEHTDRKLAVHAAYCAWKGIGG